jgi:hypothetical protein
LVLLVIELLIASSLDMLSFELDDSSSFWTIKQANINHILFSFEIGLRIEDVAYRNLMMRERCLLPDEKLRLRNILADDDLLEEIDTISSDDRTDSITEDVSIWFM